MSDTIIVNVREDTPINVSMSEAYNYNTLTNKPSINGVSLVGNKTTEDLNIDMSGKVDKVTTTSDNDRVYIIDGDGEQSVLLADRRGGGDRRTANVIVKRTFIGNIWLPNIADINNPNYATSKEYVDTALLSKQDIENWELINTADFSETAVNQVKFLKDSNGNDFSLKKFRFIFYLNSDTTISDGRIFYKDTDISNQYAVTNLHFGLSYGGTTPPAILESVFQYEDLGTILLNTCNTRANLIALPNGRWNTSSNNYNQTAPFTVFTLSWGTACLGKIELWGVKS